MRFSYGRKIEEIINEDFDDRFGNAVIKSIISYGWDNMKKMTDDEIEKIVEKEGHWVNSGFLFDLMATARRITNECSMERDFIPYIIAEMSNKFCRRKEIYFYNGDCSEEVWETLKEVFEASIDGNIEDAGMIGIKGFITEVD